MAPKWYKPSNRCSTEQVQLRVFINRLREWMGKEELYPEGQPSEKERFYVQESQ